jgi:hypothetical protein
VEGPDNPALTWRFSGINEPLVAIRLPGGGKPGLVTEGDLSGFTPAYADLFPQHDTDIVATSDF